MLNKIFIMGASTGIGKALAIHYSNKNIILGLAARSLDLLEEVALECQDNNATVHIFKVDVRKKKACIYAANKFIELADGIDLVIANSGIAGKDNLFSGDSKYVNKILNTNVLGVTNTILPFLPTMKDQGYGIIAGISSIASFLPLPDRGGYSSSKIAIRRLFDSFRPILNVYGIKTITICPGFIDTPMTEKITFKPFLKDSNNAAKAFAKAIEKGKNTYIYPWQMNWLIKLTRFIPQKIVNWFLGIVKYNQH